MIELRNEDEIELYLTCPATAWVCADEGVSREVVELRVNRANPPEGGRWRIVGPPYVVTNPSPCGGVLAPAALAPRASRIGGKEGGLMAKITELYAYIVEDQGPDDEGAAGVKTAQGWTPLVAAASPRRKGSR